MQIVSNPHLSLNQVTDQYLQSKKVQSTPVDKGFSFKSILEEKALEEQPLKFSKHASGRLADRNITLSEDQMNRLNEATNIASEKGIKESLVVVDSLAFIVNIPSHTVVTAMDNTKVNENVYTNIDGAVIM